MWHSVQDQKEVVSPKQFAELKVEQTKKQKDFIKNAIKRANNCLLEIAGGLTPSPYYGRHKGSGGDYLKQYEEYCAWLEKEYAQKEFNLIPNLIHLELCHFDAIDPEYVYVELRQRFIDAGWGERTVVHKRAGPENMVWVSLEPVEEEEGNFPLDRKLVASMEDQRVYYWLNHLKVTSDLPFEKYSNNQRRKLLLKYVIEHETKS